MRVVRNARRTILSLSILVALVLVSVAVARRPEQREILKARQSVVAMLASANALDLHHSQQSAVPGPTDGLVPLSSLSGTIQFRLPPFFAEHDAWGQELLYWSDGYRYMILSYGADGQPEFDYDQQVPYWKVPRGTLTHDPTQDIVVVDGSVYHGPAFRTFGRSTMALIRGLSTAVRSYAIDNNEYPGPTDGAVPASTLESDLVPTYSLHLPATDEWGNPLLFWSNLRSYAVISTGADGVEDEPYSIWQTADFESYEGSRTVEPARDIVLIDSVFVQWPKSAKP